MALSWLPKLTNPTALRAVPGQLVRYAIAGLALNAALYLAYLGLTALDVRPLVASSLTFVVGVPLSFIAHARFSFVQKQVPVSRRLLFVISYIVGYILQIATLATLHIRLGLTHQLSQLIAVVLVALFLFTFQKFLVFRR